MKNKGQEIQEEGANTEKEKATPLSAIFGQKSHDDEVAEDEESVIKTPVKKIVRQVEEEDEEEENIEEKNIKPVSTTKKQEISDTEEDEEENLPEVAKLRSELEKTENRNKHANKLVGELSRKVKSFEKKVNKFLEDGVLQEEEAQTLLKETVHDDIEEELESNPILKIFKIGNEGINKIRASIEEGILDEDPLLDKKIRAFDSFLEDASETEKRKTYESLAKLEKEPIRLAKKMLSIGQQYYEEIYGEIEESGNLRNFKQKYQSKIEELQKTIDKQEKQILKYKQQYEDFIPPKTMKLPTGGSKEAPEENDSSLATIFARSKAGTLSRS